MTIAHSTALLIVIIKTQSKVTVMTKHWNRTEQWHTLFLEATVFKAVASDNDIHYLSGCVYITIKMCVSQSI